MRDIVSKMTKIDKEQLAEEVQKFVYICHICVLFSHLNVAAAKTAVAPHPACRPAGGRGCSVTY